MEDKAPESEKATVLRVSTGDLINVSHPCIKNDDHFPDACDESNFWFFATGY